MAARSRQRRVALWLGSGAVALVGVVAVLEREPLARCCRTEWQLLRLRFGDDPAQRRSAGVLGDLAVVRAIPVLLELAERDNAVVLDVQLASDGRIRSSADRGMVFASQHNPYYQALVSILWRDVRGSLPRLLAAAKGDAWQARCIAIHLLGTLRREELPEAAIAAIQAAALDPDERVVAVARNVLTAKGL